MKLVYQCEFCSQTNIDSARILEHEKKCSFDPSQKKCYTCDFHGCDQFNVPYCDIEMNVINGEENGNCEGWVRE